MWKKEGGLVHLLTKISAGQCCTLMLRCHIAYFYIGPADDTWTQKHTRDCVKELSVIQAAQGLLNHGLVVSLFYSYLRSVLEGLVIMVDNIKYKGSRHLFSH